MRSFIHGIAQIIGTIKIAYDEIENVSLIYEAYRFGVSLLDTKGEIDSRRP